MLMVRQARTAITPIASAAVTFLVRKGRRVASRPRSLQGPPVQELEPLVVDWTQRGEGVCVLNLKDVKLFQALLHPTPTEGTTANHGFAPPKLQYMFKHIFM